MKTTAKAGLLGLGLMVSLPSAAMAPTIEKQKAEGKQLYAEFETTDPSGCIVTRTTLLAAEAVSRNDSTVPFRSASYNISQFDTCKSVSLVLMFCSSNVFSMTISRDLQNVHLSDPAVVCFDEVRNTDVQFNVDVTFQATESARRAQKLRSSEVGPEGHWTFQIVGDSAEGVARGAIVEGSTNYTSAPSILAVTSDTAFSSMIGQLAITALQDLLDLYGTLNRLDGTVRNGQHAIARRIDYASTMTRNVAAKDLTVLCQGAYSSGLVVAHQSGIASHIGGENHL